MENITNFELEDYSVLENRLGLFFNLFGLVLNSLSVLIFCKNGLWRKSRLNLFAYFLLISINNLTANVINLFSLIIYNSIGLLAFKTIFFKVYFCLAGATSLYSSLLEIMASLVRYITITDRACSVFAMIEKVDYRLVVVGHFLFSLIFSLYRVFQVDLLSIASLNQLTDVLQTRYNMSEQGEVVLKWLAFSNNMFRDVFCTLVLFLINVLMAVRIRRSMARKIRMLRSGGSNTMATSASQNNVTIMVLLISTKNIVCHLPYFLNYLPFLGIISGNKLCQIFAIEMLELSYSLDFFLYLKFNKRFRENFFRVVRPFLSRQLQNYKIENTKMSEYCNRSTII